MNFRIMVATAGEGAPPVPMVLNIERLVLGIPLKGVLPTIALITVLAIGSYYIGLSTFWPLLRGLAEERAAIPKLKAT